MHISEQYAEKSLGAEGRTWRLEHASPAYRLDRRAAKKSNRLNE